MFDKQTLFLVPIDVLERGANIMKKTQKKVVFLAAVLFTAVVIIAVVYFAFFRTSEIQTYTDQEHGFCVDLKKDQFIVEPTGDGEVTEIAFIDKNIQTKYPEWGGTVFTILVYDKKAVKEDLFAVLEGPQYLGESDKFYYGIWIPTDVNYPPDEPEAMNHYEELSDFARNHVAESFVVLEP